MKAAASSFAELTDRRPYGAALLIWLASCVISSGPLAVMLVSEGMPYLQTAEGRKVMGELLRSALLVPGVAVPFLVLARPRLAVVVSILFAGFYGLLGTIMVIYANAAVLVIPSYLAAVLCIGAAVLAKRLRRAAALTTVRHET